MWTAPRTRAVFGVRSEQDALTTRALAFNQGFYNLFRAHPGAAAAAGCGRPGGRVRRLTGPAHG
nr:DUF1304 family protein [Micromonospora sp. Llam0]